MFTIAATLLVSLASGSPFVECPVTERAALEAFDRSWGDASRRGDRASLQNVYSDDFAQITLLGTGDKATAIENAVRAAQQRPVNSPLSVEDNYVITCTPNTATITHRFATTTTGEGVERTTYFRSIHFLERRGGRWQVVSTASHPIDDAGVLVYMQQDWNRASAARDVAWFERNFAPDFTSVPSMTGALRNKADAIAAVRDERGSLTAELSEVAVRIHGDAAVVTGVNHFRGRDGEGRTVDRRVRFTDTFIKRDGRWLAVASQGTLIQ